MILGPVISVKFKKLLEATNGSGIISGLIGGLFFDWLAFAREGGIPQIILEIQDNSQFLKNYMKNILLI